MSKTPNYVAENMRRICADINRGTFWDNICTPTTHTGRHINRTPGNMLDRMVREGKNQVFSFQNADDMHECVTEAILTDLATIYERVRKSDGEPFTHSVRLADEIYQAEGDEVDFRTRNKGLERNIADGRIREISTDVTCVVLRKNDRMPYGFALVSAFPDPNSETAYETGRDLSAIAMETDAYKNGSYVMRAYLRAATEPGTGPCAVGYIAEHEGFPEQIAVSFASNRKGIEHQVYMDEQSTILRSYRRERGEKKRAVPCTIGPKPCNKMNLNDPINEAYLYDMYPKEAEYIAHIQDLLDEERLKMPRKERRLPSNHIQGTDAQKENDYPKP